MPFSRLLIATSLVLSAVSALADQSVYTTKLENGWGDWSWAKVSKSGKKLTVTAKPWQGLYFHHKDQASSGFSAVQFAVDPGTPQKLFVHATIKGKPLKNSAIVSVDAKKSKRASVKLSELGLSGQAFDGFWIQAADKPTTFVVTDVALKSK